MSTNRDSRLTIHMAASLDGFIHLTEVKAYTSGMVDLRYEVRGHGSELRNAT